MDNSAVQPADAALLREIAKWMEYVAASPPQMETGAGTLVVYGQVLHARLTAHRLRALADVMEHTANQPTQ